MSTNDETNYVTCIEFSTIKPPKIHHRCDPMLLVDGKSEVIRLTRNGLILLVDEDATLKRPKPQPSLFVREAYGFANPDKRPMLSVIYGPCAMTRIEGEHFVDLTEEDYLRAWTYVSPVVWRVTP